MPDHRKLLAATEAVPEVVTFHVTTYWKRLRGVSGVTQMASNRLNASEALDWVLSDFPEDAVIIEPNHVPENDVTVIRIDWSKVPDGMRYPFQGQRP